MTMYGTEFQRRADASLEAPDRVRAVQYRVGDSFDGKYQFLKFVGQGLSVTIFADAVVAKTDQGPVKIVDTNWILREGDRWYFLGDPIFQKTYEKCAEVSSEKKD
jgi:hypothetical protein